MNIQEILENLDVLFKEKRIDEVEPYLVNQLQISRKNNNWQCQLTILNELIGFFRSVDNYKKALEYGDRAVQLLKDKNLKETIPYGTTLLNIASVHRAYGNFDEAVKMFTNVARIYEKEFKSADYRLSGLYNNISVTYEEMKNYKDAAYYGRKSLKVLQQIPGEEIKSAIVMSNLATIELKLDNGKEAASYLEEALSIFRKQQVRDSHYGGALSALAHSYYLMGDFEKSVEIYCEAIAEIKRNYGENNSYVITCKNCAVIYRKLGRLQEAEKYEKLSRKAEKQLLDMKPVM